MGYYYNYNFTSPEPIYAIVREELKSYFDTGAIDDLMFPVYLDKCLAKLGRATYRISEDVLFIEDYQARLPDNFAAVREAWLCQEDSSNYTYDSPNSFYTQAASSVTIQIEPVSSNAVPCTNPECTTGCPECMPEIAMAVYKTKKEIPRVYRRQFLLRPGNISTRKVCDVDYGSGYNSMGTNAPTPYASSHDSFDIRGNKFSVNFPSGVVHLIFYSQDQDECNNQLIPNNYRIKEYIENFLKYKMFEQLLNQTNDETFNQLERKLNYYKQLSDESYIMADIEIKKQTIWEKQRRIVASYNRHKRFDIPTPSRGGRRNT